MPSSSSFEVVVAGGGVAGLEALLALRDLAPDASVTLVAPERDFVFRPMAVAEPFGRGHAERRSLEEIAATAGARFVCDALAEVRDADRTAVLASGERLSFDALLVAVGAGSEPAFAAGATWTPETDAEVFGGLLRDLDEGYVKQVAFVVPPGNVWPLPAYELALMTAWQAWSMGQDAVGITLYTPEDAPLSAFGQDASAAIRDELHGAGVQVRTSTFVHDGPGGPVAQPGNRRLEGARVVALPVARSRAPRGLPLDDEGFVLCDEHGRVEGCAATWAAGDTIAFPVKQGGIAALQADAAAESIAARAGADVEPAPFRPVLRGVVLTGRGRQWLRHDPADAAGDDTAVDDRGEDRHALWWPPTKVAGRYLSPLLSPQEGAPAGQAVDLDLEAALTGVADALRQARQRGDAPAPGHALGDDG